MSHPLARGSRIAVVNLDLDLDPQCLFRMLRSA